MPEDVRKLLLAGKMNEEIEFLLLKGRPVSAQNAANQFYEDNIKLDFREVFLMSLIIANNIEEYSQECEELGLTQERKG